MNVREWLDNELETETDGRLAFAPIWSGMNRREREALIALLDELQLEAYMEGYQFSRDARNESERTVVGF